MTTCLEAHAQALAGLEQPPTRCEVAEVTERHAHMAAIASADMLARLLPLLERIAKGQDELLALLRVGGTNRDGR